MKRKKSPKGIFIILSLFITISILVLYLFNKNIINNTFKNNSSQDKEISQEELRQLSNEYFSESYGVDDEGNQEISGGHAESFYFNINGLYDKMPFDIAVEVDTRLNSDYNTLLDVIKHLEDREEPTLKEWYEENSNFFISRFGILSYSDFKAILDHLNILQGQILEGEVMIRNYATGTISLDVLFKAENKIKFIVDIIVLDEGNMTYYWSVSDGK